MAAYRAINAAVQGPPRRGAQNVFRCSAVDSPHGRALARPARAVGHMERGVPALRLLVRQRPFRAPFPERAAGRAGKQLFSVNSHQCGLCALAGKIGGSGLEPLNCPVNRVFRSTAPQTPTSEKVTPAGAGLPCARHGPDRFSGRCGRKSGSHFPPAVQGLNSTRSGICAVP